MDRRLVTGDEGASQLLGFIVGLAILTGSLAIATYFITTVPESGADQESQELAGSATRGIQTLTSTPGEPTDWETISDLSSDDLRRVGLLKQGTTDYASRQKIDRIQEGDLTGERILESWNIDPEGHSLRIEGRVQSIPIGDVPGVETYGVVHTNHPTLSLTGVMAETKSQNAAETYETINPSYTYDPHSWQFGVETRPTTELGNTVADHAWFVETQLVPLLAGAEGTYSTADHGGGDWENAVAQRRAFNNYDGVVAYPPDDDAPPAPTRWHVIQEGNPQPLPGSAPSWIDEHVLGVGYRRDLPESPGWGHWRVEDGARSTVLLGSFDVSSASSAEITFDQALKVDDDVTSSCTPSPCSPPENECEDPSDTSCVMIRPSIMFWNTTGTNHWSRIRENPADCNPSPSWNHTLTGSATGGAWSQGHGSDLCEALEHSGSTLWLSLFWDTDCFDATGGNTTCGLEQAVRGWFVDNIEVTVDGETVYSNDFEPPTKQSDLQLFVSNGVDHARMHAPAQDYYEANTMAWIHSMVQAGQNVVSLSPDGGGAGQWLAPVGLEAVSTSRSSDVTTDQEHLLTRYPNDLPKQSTSYFQEEVSWEQDAPTMPSTWPGSTPNALDVLQSGPDEATMMVGKPYADSGRVAAIAYNHSEFDDKQLRKDVYENLHAASTFIDPTFTVGSELPDPGTVQVYSERRVMLVGVTPDGRHVLPVEITMWLWPRG